jgi:hypothetical protein
LGGSSRRLSIIAQLTPPKSPHPPAPCSRTRPPPILRMSKSLPQSIAFIHFLRRPSPAPLSFHFSCAGQFRPCAGQLHQGQSCAGQPLAVLLASSFLSTFVPLPSRPHPACATPMAAALSSQTSRSGHGPSTACTFSVRSSSAFDRTPYSASFTVSCTLCLLACPSTLQLPSRFFSCTARCSRSVTLTPSASPSPPCGSFPFWRITCRPFSTLRVSSSLLRSLFYLAFSLCCSDTYLLKEEQCLHYRPPVHQQGARAPFLLRLSAIALGPALILMAWSLMYTTDQVYAVHIPLSVTFSIAAVVLLLVPLVYGRVLVRVSADAQTWLLKQEAAAASAHAQHNGLLQHAVYM